MVNKNYNYVSKNRHPSGMLSHLMCIPRSKHTKLHPKKILQKQKSLVRMPKKSILTFIVGVFMIFSIISMVSAWNFDDVFEYSNNDTTYTLKNCDIWIGVCLDEGETIFKADLLWGNTKVGVGDGTHVGTMGIMFGENQTDTILEALEVKNLKNGGFMTKGVQYKVKRIVKDEINTYDLQCHNVTTNTSTICDYVLNGTKEINVTEWLPITNPKFNFEAGKYYEIGIFVDTKLGDHGDWIPQIKGKKILNWAEFEVIFYDDFQDGSLNTTIWTHTTSYYQETGGYLEIRDDSSATGPDGEVGSKTFGNGDFRAEVSVSCDQTGGGGGEHCASMGVVETVGANPANGFWLDRQSANGYISYYNGSSWATTGVSFSVGTDYLYRIQRIGTNLSFWIDDVYIDSVTDSSSNDKYLNLYTGRNSGTTPIGRYDWVNVTLPEPDDSPTVTSNSPVDEYNSTTTNIQLNCTVTDDQAVANMTFWIGGVAEEVNTSGFNGTYLYTHTFPEGTTAWFCGGTDNASQTTNSSSQNINVDSINPSIVINSPTGTIASHDINTNLTLNVTASDTNLDSCWHNFTGTNVTFNCTTGIDNLTISDPSQKSVTVWVNDTFGNINQTTSTWTYQIFLLSESFTTSTLEGNTETFKINYQTNGTDITSSYLNYNGVNYTGSINSTGNNFTLTRSITVPTVTTNTNYSFYWIAIQNGLRTDRTTQNQTVLNLDLSNCTTYNTTVLYNFTMVDEELQTEINESAFSVDPKVNLQIYNPTRTTEITNFSASYSVNPFGICLSSNLSTGESYVIDVQVEYDATNYVQEFYHIQNSSLTSSSFPTNITLYSLNDSDDEPFELIVRDTSYLPLRDALIYVDRKYVDEGVYKTVEVPKTDDDGLTLAHLVLDDVIYRFRIVKDGVTLQTVTDVLATCIPTLSQCEIDFNAFLSGVDVPDFESTDDFNFTIDYDNSTREVSTIFNIPSGEPSEITLTVTKMDALGTSICSDTLTSSSGTLSCVVGNSFGNETILATLTKDGNFQAYGQVSLDQTPSELYGSAIVFFGLFIMLSLIGAGVSDEPKLSIMFLIIGVIFLFAMNIVASNGYIGAGSSILYLIVALVIVLIKAERRNS